MPHGVRTALLLRLGHRVLYGETEACGDETSVRTCTAINCASGIGSVLDAHRTASASSGCYQTWILTRNQRMHALQVLHTGGLVGARHRRSLASLFPVRRLVQSQCPRPALKLHIVDRSHCSALELNFNITKTMNLADISCFA